MSFGYDQMSVKQLLAHSECCEELTCDKQHALMNQQQVTQNDAQSLSFLSQGGKKQKQFKSVNCKVFAAEITAAYDLNRKYEALEVLAGIIDQSQEINKNKYSKKTQQQAKEFEAQLFQFIKDYNERGFSKVLESYYDELQKQQQNSDYQPSCTVTQMMDNCNQLVQEFSEELKALNKKKERTLLAQKLFGLEPSNLQTLPLVEKQISTGLKTFAVY